MTGVTTDVILTNSLLSGVFSVFIEAVSVYLSTGLQEEGTRPLLWRLKNLDSHLHLQRDSEKLLCVDDEYSSVVVSRKRDVRRFLQFRGNRCGGSYNRIGLIRSPHRGQELADSSVADGITTAPLNPLPRRKLVLVPVFATIIEVLRILALNKPLINFVKFRQSSVGYHCRQFLVNLQLLLTGHCSLLKAAKVSTTIMKTHSESEDDCLSTCKGPTLKTHRRVAQRALAASNQSSFSPSLPMAVNLAPLPAFVQPAGFGPLLNRCNHPRDVGWNRNLTTPEGDGVLLANADLQAWHNRAQLLHGQATQLQGQVLQHQNTINAQQQQLAKAAQDHTQQQLQHQNQVNKATADHAAALQQAQNQAAKAVADRAAEFQANRTQWDQERLRLQQENREAAQSLHSVRMQLEAMTLEKTTAEQMVSLLEQQRLALVDECNRLTEAATTIRDSSARLALLASPAKKAAPTSRLQGTADESSASQAGSPQSHS